jgi:feruloyl-CoA hydratase/lyase
VAYSEIEFEMRGAIAVVRLNRPDRKNALSPEMNAELLDVFTRIEQDPSVRGVVLTGSADSFSSGLDLNESFLETFQTVDPDRYRWVFDSILAWYRKLYDLGCPTLAAVNGHCYGGGIVPVSLCDVALAADTAMFGLSEINFAHFPAGGSTWAVSHFLAPKHYYYLCLSGDPIDAETAARMGLVTRVVPAADLETETWRLVEKLAGKHPVAYRTAKTMCRMTPRMRLDEAIELEMAHIHENLFLTEGEMVKVALKQFAGKRLRPGTGQTYVPEREGETQ